MDKRFWLLGLLLLLVLVACGGADEPEPAATNTPPVEVNEAAEGPAEDSAESQDDTAEEEMAEDAEPFVDLTPQPTSRFGEGAAQLVDEDEQSTGQEDRSRPTPLAPRDKQSSGAQGSGAQDSGAQGSGAQGSGAQSEEVNSAQDTQIAQTGAGGSAVVETAAAVAIDSADSAPPRSENSATTTAIINTPAATATSSQPPATSVPASEPTPTEAASLSAGAINDNERFEAYLDYIASYDGEPIEAVDVSLRQRFVVLDAAEQPVVGAEIVLYDNDRGELAQTLRTRADGGAWFFPHAVSDEIPSTYDVELRWRDEIVYAESFVPSAGEGEQVITLGAVDEMPLQLDILLLLDATGSMGDEILQLKDNIRAIAQRTIESPAEPDLRFALVSYRDQGDEYVTQVEDFSADYDNFSDRLQEVKALGGGDYPEDLNAGLDAAVNAVSWRPSAIQLIFLVADAPPQLDYGQENHYAVSALRANELGIKIFPIASSGLDEQGEYVLRQLAQMTDGQFVFLVDGENGEVEEVGEVEGSETSFAVSDYTVDSLENIVMQLIEVELGFQIKR